jgi:glycogen debranching enzyme
MTIDEQDDFPVQAVDAPLAEGKSMQSKVVLPVLDIEEIGGTAIDRHKLPDDIKDLLHDWEDVIYIHTPKIVYPTKLPSAVTEIKRLTLAPTIHQLGEFGPSIASISTEENKQLESLTKYEVVHGRDALQTALHIHKQHPKLLAATIVSLAEKQGLEDEPYTTGQPFRQEEAGKIMLLSREPEDPVGKRFSEKLGWGWPFYGSIDATPLFISAIATYAFEHDPTFFQTTYSDLKGNQKTIKDAFDLSVKWLLARTDENPEQLLEFHNKPDKGGILNQAWKDSAGAYIHADGSWANHAAGIASVEVQGLAYDAYVNAARVYGGINEDELAQMLQARAAELRQTVLETFWVEDERGGYFVLGTDRDDAGQLRQMQVRTSNMGQLLKTNLLKGDEPDIQSKVRSVVRTLCSPEMLSPNGLRTLSNREVAFRKRGYHVGNVWLWDNDAAGDGMANHGYYGLARYFWRCSLINIYKHKMFPEFVPGGDDADEKLNEREVYVYDHKHQILHLFEQLPQHIQAWSVSSGLATKYNLFLVPNSAEEGEALDLEQKILSKLPPNDYV